MQISLAQARRRARSAVLCAAALFAACSGGEPIERFVAQRLIVLGDETSVLTGNGGKHSVNALAADGVTLDCKANPLWVQILAGLYGLTFAQCPNGNAPVTVQTFAAAGAQVGGISAQVDSVGGFVEKDLVTLLVGANDILAQYALIGAGTQTEAGAVAVLTAAGEALAGQVNRIANTGGKVLISTVPDLGLTPFAIGQGTANADLLTRLTREFNTRLRINIINDGRRIGLLLTDELIQAVVRNPAGVGLVNVRDGVCVAGLGPTECTTLTLVPVPAPAASASASTYLWANDRLFSAAGHSLLGNLALSRATGNPF
ncbi:MAG: SGNH/GDSL hydrolase family protein [Burkholderiaceae bacterium]